VSEEPLVPVFMPALVAVLLNKDKAKGSPLTEAEVLKIRDACHVVMAPLDVARKMAESRGYEDIDPERAWEEWSAIRPTLI